MTASGFAIRADGKGWRALGAGDVCGPGEVLAVEPPAGIDGGARSVSMRQARIALHRAGLLGAVNAAIEAMPDARRVEAAIEWEFASTVASDHPLISIVAASAGLSQQDVSDLFSTAAGL